MKKAIERSKADEHARQQHQSKGAEQEARELELAMQMSLLEAERLELRLAKQGLWDITNFPSSPSPKAASALEGKKEQESVDISQLEEEHRRNTAALLTQKEAEHQSIIQDQLNELNNIRKEKEKREEELRIERMEKDKSLGELENLKRREKDHIRETRECLTSP